MNEYEENESGTKHQPRHSFARKFTIRSLKVVAIILIFEYLVLPQIAGARKAVTLLQHINFAYVLLGVALEVAALLAYAMLTISILPKSSLGLWQVFRIDLSSLALSHVTPAGTAGGTGLSLRLLITKGIRATDAAFAIATQGIGSAVVLNVILWIALLVSIPIWGINSIYLTVTVIGVLLIALFCALVIAFTRGEKRFTRTAVRIFSKLPFLDENKIIDILGRISERIRDLLSDPPLLKKALIWAVLNWLFDAASLWVFLAAFGQYENIDGLLVAYAIANVLAAIPVTPAGLGVVEAALTTSLVGFGTPRGIAILGVISYRLINFWLPIPGGALAYISLGIGNHQDQRKQISARSRISSKLNPNVIGQDLEIKRPN